LYIHDSLYNHGPLACRCRSTSPAATAQAHDCYQHAIALANAIGLRQLQTHCHRGLDTLYATTGQREQAYAELSTAIAQRQHLVAIGLIPPRP
jgi:hypothetical protein